MAKDLSLTIRAAITGGPVFESSSTRGDIASAQEIVADLAAEGAEASTTINLGRTNKINFLMLQLSVEARDILPTAKVTIGPDGDGQKELEIKGAQIFDGATVVGLLGDLSVMTVENQTEAQAVTVRLLVIRDVAD